MNKQSFVNFVKRLGVILVISYVGVFIVISLLNQVYLGKITMIQLGVIHFIAMALFAMCMPILDEDDAPKQEEESQ